MLAVPGADAMTAPTRVVINGTTLPVSTTESIKQTLYVAVRPAAQALGADVATDAQRKTVTITTLLRQVVFTLDDPWATVNGQRVRLTAPARRSRARIVLPLRALAQAFGAAVSYDRLSHRVMVSVASTGAPFARATSAARGSSTSTIEGTVTLVSAASRPPAVEINSNGTNYTLSVPEGTSVEFRDVHGAVSGSGVLSSVKPGDALIATLDAGGHLIAIADMFSAINGTIAAVADQSMVLTSGKVIAADPATVSVTLDGKLAQFSSLRAGDKVSVRADPKSGKVRDVVALTPGGFAVSATSTPSSPQGTGSAVRITNVGENANHVAFRAGQTLKVWAEGTPGARAFFDLSNVIIDNPMREVRAGRYEGDYFVGVGTNLTDAPVLVRLSRGGETALAEAPDPLTIVTTPPVVKETAPAADARINTSRPNIFATFATVGDKGLDPASLRLIVNGRDVSTLATRTPTFVSYYPPAEISSGPVLVEVKGSDIAGNTLDYRWSFVISG